MGRSGRRRHEAVIRGGDDARGPEAPGPGKWPRKARMRLVGNRCLRFGGQAERNLRGAVCQHFDRNEQGAVRMVVAGLGTSVRGSELLPPSEAEQKALAEWGDPTGSDTWFAWCIAQQQLRDCDAAHATPQRGRGDPQLASSPGCSPSETSAPTASASPERSADLEYLEHPAMTQAADSELACCKARAAAAEEALRLERAARVMEEAAHSAERERLERTAAELQEQLSALRAQCDACLEERRASEALPAELAAARREAAATSEELERCRAQGSVDAQLGGTEEEVAARAEETADGPPGPDGAYAGYGVPPSLRRLEIRPDALVFGDTIARGTFAEVEAAQLEGADVAVKIFHAPGYEEHAQEVRMLERCQHRHVVQLLGVWDDGLGLCIVTECCNRGCVYKLVVQSAMELAVLRTGEQPDVPAGITWAVKARWVGQAAEALQFMHANGVLHRDIKSPNLLVKAAPRAPPSEWVLKLCDFGLAALAVDAASDTDRVGSMSCMAPEVWRAEGYSSASDVYALGVTYVEVLAGRTPFEDAGWSTVQRLVSRGSAGPLLPPSIGGVPLPAAARELAASMVAFVPQERPSVRDVIDAIGSDLRENAHLYEVEVGVHNNAVEWGWQLGDDDDDGDVEQGD